MPARAHRHLQPAVACQSYAGDHVILALGEQDRGGVAVGPAGVEHAADPRLLVAGIAPPDDLAGEGHEISDWPPSTTMSTAFR